jgi:hypothetical protein
MYRAWGISETHTKFLSESLMGTEHFRNVDVGEAIILKPILEKYSSVV